MECWTLSHPLTILRNFISLAAGLLLSSVVFAGNYECTPVDPSTQGHTTTFNTLTDALQRPPTELVYCEGNYPRWAARWNVYESESGWRKFATGICFDRYPLFCKTTRHAVAPDSHEVVDLTFDLSLQKVAELFSAVKAVSAPETEIARIEYVEVTDGGTWSEEAYGYSVYMLEPPTFANGDVSTFIRACAESCAWVHPKFHYPGSWSPSSSDKWLRDLQREKGVVLIETLHYLGR